MTDEKPIILDAIVAEFRAVREAISSEFNGDLARIIEHFHTQMKLEGREIVPVPGTRPKELHSAA